MKNRDSLTRGTVARWIRRRRIASLERNADKLEREFAGSVVASYARAEATQMRRKAHALRRSLR